MAPIESLNALALPDGSAKMLKLSGSAALLKDAAPFLGVAGGQLTYELMESTVHIFLGGLHVSVKRSVMCTAEWSLHLDVLPSLRRARRSEDVGCMCSHDMSLGSPSVVNHSDDTMHISMRCHSIAREPSVCTLMHCSCV